MLLYAIIFISLACLLYTVGVWAEKIQKKLNGWHVLVFWGGFIFDTLGTGAMESISGGIFQASFHGITGMTAIILMFFHAMWASVVIIRKDEKMKSNFHRFSLVVWIIWLIPMVSGIIYGVSI
ncbi:MAG: HsmA family protein [Acetobacterium sp.]